MVFIAVSTYTKGFHMVPILNALNVQCAVYGNHDFGIYIYIAVAALYIFVQCFSFLFSLQHVSKTVHMPVY